MTEWIMTRKDIDYIPAVGQWRYMLRKISDEPYRELDTGETIYIFDNSKDAIEIVVSVIDVKYKENLTRKEIQYDLRKIHDESGEGDEYEPDDQYSQKHKDATKYKAFRIRPLTQRLEVKRPDGFKFPQNGFPKLTDELRIEWGIQEFFFDEIENGIDKYVGKTPIINLLKEYNGINPEATKKIIETTIRNDGKIASLLKKLANYKCQFPGCNANIKIKNKFHPYVEVAHIIPYSECQMSEPTNLLVLCPNHHKEFDYGNLNIATNTDEYIEGTLNDVPFKIKKLISQIDKGHS